jgi:hypothetical protein
MAARLLCTAIVLGAVAQTPTAQAPAWRVAADSRPLSVRIQPPAGYTRVPVPPGSFGAWLRELPLRAGRPQVRLFDGRLKSNQSAQAAIIDIDTGARDLQQCADAVMRLRAEYLRASGREGEVAFRFTSGDTARWTAWRDGLRPVVSGNRVRWASSAARDDSYASFRRYLDTVFTYAGSHSLERELTPVRDAPIEPGDVVIQGGFPGHAVIVLDVARRPDGGTVFLLAQSYMPAQDMHVLANPADAALSPWYIDTRSAPLISPEWRFPPHSIRRWPLTR